LQKLPPTGNKCNDFGPHRRATPNLLQKLPPTGNKCDGFRWWRVILVLGIPLAVLAALRGLWSP
jgi:hypothetical protein